MSDNGESNNRFKTKVKDEIPHLFWVHCIAYMEALASKDAIENMPSFACIKKLSSQFYACVRQLFFRNEKLQEILQLMEMERLKVIYIHHIRWLSIGQVIERLAKIMPTILALFGGEEDDEELYFGFTNFYVIFFIYLLGDVLRDLNILDKKIQEENLDLTDIGAWIEITIRALKRKFLVDNEFGLDAPLTTKLLKISRGGSIDFQDAMGQVHSHRLHYDPLPNSTFEGTLEDCKEMARKYVERVIACLEFFFRHKAI
jgi:hypothetical protein